MYAERKCVRVGGGSAGAEERIDPAVELAEKGRIGYLCFDSLSENELSNIEMHKRQDPSAKGYDVFTEPRLTQVMPVCAHKGVKIIGNMGAGNPLAAQDLAIDIARRAGLKGLKVAAVLGDNVLQLVKELNLEIAETGRKVQEFGADLISAHAYIPADPIAEALRQGADIVLTGRVGDASLFLGPLMYEFGWKEDDWDLRAKGIVVGHLLECAGQVTGGYFADPPYKVVPDLHRLGFPIAEVYADAETFITKVEGSGGLVSPATCKEQMLYEVHDPSHYIEADVISDFSDIDFEQAGPDRVRISGVVRGKPKPEKLKVSLGVKEGYLGAGTVYYGGPGALGRAKLAAESLKKRFEYLKLQPEELEFYLMGVNGLYDSAPGVPETEPWEVGLRTAARTRELAEAILIARESSTTLSNNGPAAVTCRQRQYELKEIVGYYHTFIPRDKVTPTVVIKEV